MYQPKFEPLLDEISYNKKDTSINETKEFLKLLKDIIHKYGIKYKEELTKLGNRIIELYDNIRKDNLDLLDGMSYLGVYISKFSEFIAFLVLDQNESTNIINKMIEYINRGSIKFIGDEEIPSIKLMMVMSKLNNAKIFSQIVIDFFMTQNILIHLIHSNSSKIHQYLRLKIRPDTFETLYNIKNTDFDKYYSIRKQFVMEKSIQYESETIKFISYCIDSSQQFETMNLKDAILFTKKVYPFESNQVYVTYKTKDTTSYDISNRSKEISHNDHEQKFRHNKIVFEEESKEIKQQQKLEASQIKSTQEIEDSNLLKLEKDVVDPSFSSDQLSHERPFLQKINKFYAQSEKKNKNKKSLDKESPKEKIIHEKTEKRKLDTEQKKQAIEEYIINNITPQTDKDSSFMSWSYSPYYMNNTTPNSSSFNKDYCIYKDQNGFEYYDISINSMPSIHELSLLKPEARQKLLNSKNIEINRTGTLINYQNQHMIENLQRDQKMFYIKRSRAICHEPFPYMHQKLDLLSQKEGIYNARASVFSIIPNKRRHFATSTIILENFVEIID